MPSHQCQQLPRGRAGICHFKMQQKMMGLYVRTYDGTAVHVLIHTCNSSHRNSDGG